MPTSVVATTGLARRPPSSAGVGWCGKSFARCRCADLPSTGAPDALHRPWSAPADHCVGLPVVGRARAAGARRVLHRVVDPRVRRVGRAALPAGARGGHRARARRGPRAVGRGPAAARRRAARRAGERRGAPPAGRGVDPRGVPLVPAARSPRHPDRRRGDRRAADRRGRRDRRVGLAAGRRGVLDHAAPGRRARLVRGGRRAAAARLGAAGRRGAGRSADGRRRARPGGAAAVAARGRPAPRRRPADHARRRHRLRPAHPARHRRRGRVRRPLPRPVADGPPGRGRGSRRPSRCWTRSRRCCPASSWPGWSGTARTWRSPAPSRPASS